MNPDNLNWTTLSDTSNLCFWFEVTNYRFHNSHISQFRISKILFQKYLSVLHSWKSFPIYSGTTRCCRMCNKLLEILPGLFVHTKFKRGDANPQAGRLQNSKSVCCLSWYELFLHIKIPSKHGSVPEAHVADDLLLMLWGVTVQWVSKIQESTFVSDFKKCYIHSVS